ncbi:defective in Cullin neddylation protein 1 [Coprinopsis cinerea okayama7|uniref:Defective in cullin neddylation protein n=1 Tax=Coprinopsis cinerea (strain Okayama-7 / 130 / ATCC MYA-4618 / FGSC 9003) TaxID=240176 RepID=A8NI83_COPC7|nr:defective in Cullin neddylation protein 1 [Coprinopsis cinerea okayama7\|eukprot:XP_001833933.1 defective in Cullin neddylation protein 1 [Coprinopsis cinerea okayama7\
MVDKKMEENIVQFVAVTGATTRDARRFLETYHRLDVAMDNYFNNPQQFANSKSRGHAQSAAPSTSKLNALFDKYKDPDGNEISIDGTIKFCEDLEIDPEDVVMLAVAYELKSPRVGEWTKQGWVEGLKSLGVDSIQGLKALLPKLRNQLGSDPKYFKKVYSHTFDFARNEGQRSLGLDTAQAFWALLLPHGLEGGALSHVDEDQDVSMNGAGGEGFKREYVDWWFEFLQAKGGKGVSKDTWNMLFDFVRTIDSQFKNYDPEAAWPSTIDDFVEYARQRLQS